jgi:hypothetical protein
VGFAVTGGDQELDKVNRRRRIKKAFLDHLAFVPDPAYAGAGVLSVRASLAAIPALDELVAFMQARHCRKSQNSTGPFDGAPRPLATHDT